MADDTRLKSSYELAMERLRQKDAAEGVEIRALSDEEKAEIAEIRSRYQAKLAEQEILEQSKLATTWDPAEREALAAGIRRERERLVAEREAKIEKIRRR